MKEAYAIDLASLRASDRARLRAAERTLDDAWRHDAPWDGCAAAIATALPGFGVFVGGWRRNAPEMRIFSAAGGLSISEAGRLARAVAPVRARVYSPTRPDPDRNRVVRFTARWASIDPDYTAAVLSVLRAHGLGPILRFNHSRRASDLTAFATFPLDRSRVPSVREATLLHLLRPRLATLAAANDWLGEAAPGPEGLAAIVDAIGTAAFVVDGRGGVLYANPAARGTNDVTATSLRAGLGAALRGRSDAFVATARFDLLGRSVALVVRRGPPATDTACGAPTRPLLSPRLRRVAELVAQGLGDKQIADQMQLTHASAREYVKRAYRALGVRSRVELVRAMHGVTATS